jgi:hypothetical protein
MNLESAAPADVMKVSVRTEIGSRYFADGIMTPDGFRTIAV